MRHVIVASPATLALAAHAQAQTTTLPAVAVVATPLVEESRVDAFSTIVTDEQFREANVADLASALRRTPGVQIARFSPVGAVFIRGIGASRPGEFFPAMKTSPTPTTSAGRATPCPAEAFRSGSWLDSDGMSGRAAAASRPSERRAHPVETAWQVPTQRAAAPPGAVRPATLARRRRWTAALARRAAGLHDRSRGRIRT